MRILVIEDEPKVARFLERGLRQQSYAVDVAGDGEEGLQLAGDHPYDLIVLDVMLPGRDGFGVLRELRAARQATRVLMLTARDGLADRVRVLLWNSGDRRYDVFSEVALATQSFAARVADVNGDGKPDLVLLGVAGSVEVVLSR